MKKIMMMLVMATVALTASAQNEVGQLTLQPKIGVTLANLTDTKQNDQKGEFKAGLVVGVEAEYGISEKFSVAAGLLYSMQGCNFGEYKVSAGGETLAGWDKNERNFNYLNIPIVANLYFAKGWAIKAGVQPGFLLSAKYKLDGVGAQESFNEDIKDACKTFDFSIPLGISYEYEKAVFDLRYNLGVTKVNKDGDNSSKNSVIQFTVGYKFAL